MQDTTEFIYIPFETMLNQFQKILVKHDFSHDKARTLADIFASNSLEGVYTHGVNRFSRFISYVREGYVKVEAEAEQKTQGMSLEQWHGNLGPGPLNAIQCTERAMQLSDVYGMGCVALGHTNHWMRGGYYGWHAAKKGYAFIGWTNTTGNMPAWGAVDSKVGNNPLVIAIPYDDDAIVLDMAMSQYSYGALHLYELKDEKLPTPGGYTKAGELTDNASAIITSRRALPIGFWKGSGLSLLLDILGATLSGGLSTSEISKLNAEHALSQVFIAFNLSKLKNHVAIEKTISDILKDFQSSVTENGKPPRYPGERALITRKENLAKGIPVSQSVWKEILTL